MSGSAMNLKVTFKASDKETVAELLKSTKHLELCPTVATVGMDEEDVKEAFTLVDLVSAEFRSDPMSVQCFDLRIVNAVNALAAKWNDEGRP